MATLKQKQALDKIVENRGNVSKAMREVGYSEKTAKNPKNLTESKGFKEELAKYGLTDELLTSALVEDIEKKPQNRVSELRLGAELLGLNKKEGDAGNKTLIVMISGESATRYKVLGRDNTDHETSL